MTTNELNNPIGKYGFWCPMGDGRGWCISPGVPVKCTDTRRTMFSGIQYKVKPVMGMGGDMWVSNFHEAHPEAQKDMRKAADINALYSGPHLTDQLAALEAIDAHLQSRLESIRADIEDKED